MFKKISILATLLFALFYSSAKASDTLEVKYSISGYVRDALTGEDLIGATVYVKEINIGLATNLYGFYSVSLPKGNYTLEFSYIGYQTLSQQLQVGGDMTHDVQLSPQVNELEEVVISSEGKDQNITSVQMSSTKLPMSKIKNIPMLMGEVDVIKSIQLLPGITTSGEGNSGFYVRGGNVDQNLILLDGATVYNPSHIGGFFSVFNGDAIKNVEVYKGGIPAEYGGRLASVLDIRMKEGNTRKFSGNGGIGLISSRLTLEGPIIKDKASFIISGRRTYADLFLPILAKDSIAKESKGFFYDLNAKINYKVNEKNKVFISGYFGRDVIAVGDIFGMDYGNKTGSFRWNHIYSGNLFSNLTVIFSDFDYSFDVHQDPLSLKWTSHIIDKSVSNDYTLYLNPRNTISGGVQLIHHTFKPGTLKPLGDETFFQEQKLDNSYALEYGAYLGNEQKLFNNLTLRYGLRFSMFQNIGPGKIYEFDENYEWVDSSIYKKGESYNIYTSLEPRLGLNYIINGNNSIKAGYNRMAQYIQLASNTTATTPMDIWFPANPNIKPQYADQVALGYFRNFLDHSIETSVEVYYKKMYNTIDFKDHAQLLLNKYIDGEYRIGKGYSYGIELMARKQSGKFTGWVSYTLSKTRRQIEEINNGKEYPAPFDKPHDVSVVLSYELTPRIMFSGNWVYSSPSPYTVPLAKFSYGNAIAPVYSDRNAYRFPNTAYHRLDMSVNFEFKPAKYFDHSLNVSVYNVYNRHNTYSISFRESDENPGETEVVKLFIFKVIPSVTYNFNF